MADEKLAINDAAVVMSKGLIKPYPPVGGSDEEIVLKALQQGYVVANNRFSKRQAAMMSKTLRKFFENIGQAMLAAVIFIVLTAGGCQAIPAAQDGIVQTQTTQSQKLLIGWAGRDVTPDKPAVLQGQHYPRISRYVMDPLTVTALAIESADGAERAVMVSLDAINLKPQTGNSFKDRLAETGCGLEARDVFVSCTHTHSGPVQRPSRFKIPENCIGDTEYTDFLAGRLAEAVAEAWNNRSEGSIAWGLSHAAVGRNRQVVYADGLVAMYGLTSTDNFTGFESGAETLVQSLFTWDTRGQLTGAVINLACPSQCSELSEYITADYWADLRRELRSRHGEDLHVLGQCAAAGDIAPRALINKAAEIRMLKLRGLMKDNPEDSDHLKFMERCLGRRRDIALRVSAAVEETLATVSSDRRSRPVFAHVYRDIELPRFTVTAARRDEAVAKAAECEARLSELTKGAAGYASATATLNRSKVLIAHFDKQDVDAVMPMGLHVLRIGDVAMATNRFELYHDYELRIRGRSPALQTFVVQLTGGPSGRYLATRRALAGGSYGANPSSCKVGAEGGDILVENTLEAINELFPAEAD